MIVNVRIYKIIFEDNVHKKRESYFIIFETLNTSYLF